MNSGFAITISASDRASATIEGVNRRLAAMRAPAERVSKSLSKFSDVSGLNAVSGGFKSVAGSALSAMRNISRVVEPLAAVTGATSLAGMYRMVQSWSQFGSQLGFAAQRMGITAGQLQSLQGAAVLAGGTAGGLTSGLQTLGQTMYDAIGGRAPEAAALFNQLGIAFDDGTRHARKVSDVFPQLANRVAAIKDPFTQARVATALLGGAAEDLLPFLRKGAAGMTEYETKARAYGVMNQAGVEGANRMRESFAGVELAAMGLSYSISEKLAPSLGPLLDQFSNWIATSPDLRQGVDDVVGVVKDFGNYLRTLQFKQILSDTETFARNANAVAQSLGGWKTVIEGVMALKLAGWAANALAPFTLVLRMLSLVPGSGVTAAALAEVGIPAVVAGAAAAPLAYGLKKGADAISASIPGQTAYEKAHANANMRSGRTGHIDPVRGAMAGAGNLSSAMGYFTSMGWSRAQAAGIVANLQAESGLMPNRYGDSGQAYGVAQWHADRQAAFKSWAGHDLQHSTMAEQLAFVNYELTQGGEQRAGSKLRGATTAYDAGAAVSRYYERPRAVAEAANNRGNAAAALGGADIGPGGGGGSGKVMVDTKVTITDKRTTSSSSAKATGIAGASAPKVDTTPVYSV